MKKLTLLLGLSALSLRAQAQTDSTASRPYIDPNPPLAIRGTFLDRVGIVFDCKFSSRTCLVMYFDRVAATYHVNTVDENGEVEAEVLTAKNYSVTEDASTGITQVKFDEATPTDAESVITFPGRKLAPQPGDGPRVIRCRGKQGECFRVNTIIYDRSKFDVIEDNSSGTATCTAESLTAKKLDITTADG